MSDGRRKTDSQKARTQKARIARTSSTRRKLDWHISRQAADLAGYSINAHLTTQWGQEPCEEKDKETWRRLRICLKRSDVPWVAMRAPEYAPRKGHHMHTVFHVPDHAWEDVVTMIERITGRVAAWVALEGRDLGPWTRGVVAKSADESWMLQRNIPALGTNDCLIDYIIKQSGKEKTVGRHQRSEALLEMTGEHSGAICGDLSAK